jgi:hypothetical protein
MIEGHKPTGVDSSRLIVDSNLSRCTIWLNPMGTCHKLRDAIDIGYGTRKTNKFDWIPVEYVAMVAVGLKAHTPHCIDRSIPTLAGTLSHIFLGAQSFL